jgi:hypothetical protein
MHFAAYHSSISRMVSTVRLFLSLYAMPIFSAIGLGITIVVLQIMVPKVFSELETTAILFLHGAQASAITATSLAATANVHSLALPDASDMPQAPQIRE